MARATAREVPRRHHRRAAAVASSRAAARTANCSSTCRVRTCNSLNEYAARSSRRACARCPAWPTSTRRTKPGKPELRVHINRDKAADLNVNVASIATALRTLVGGDDQATTYREGDDRYDVQLRVEKEFRDSPAALERLYVPSASLGNVPVSQRGVSLEQAGGPTQIERYNRQRQILISANLGRAANRCSNVLPILNKTVEELNMPPEYRTGLVGRSKEFGRAAAGLRDRVRAVHRFHVHGAGGAVRELHRSDHDSAQPAALGAVRAALAGAGRTRILDHLHIARHSRAVRHRQEELHSSDRSHQEPARRRHAAPAKRSSTAARTGCGPS